MPLKKLLILLLLLALLGANAQPARAQQPAAPNGGADPGAAMPMLTRPEPPMKNVFFNVLWGSVVGGMVYSSMVILDDTKSKSEKYKFKFLTVQFITGATGGGIVGLVTGIYLSMSGISFDPSRSRIAHQLPPLPGGWEVQHPDVMAAHAIPLGGFTYQF